MARVNALRAEDWEEFGAADGFDASISLSQSKAETFPRHKAARLSAPARPEFADAARIPEKAIKVDQHRAYEVRQRKDCANPNGQESLVVNGGSYSTLQTTTFMCAIVLAMLAFFLGALSYLLTSDVLAHIALFAMIVSGLVIYAVLARTRSIFTRRAVAFPTAQLAES